uniref:Bifunctional inhibitor/plant lipid transfer protein/seed storage helical domain-containing protein n=1 Tax=Leersia perrieri TaxID=77586 RepID=A0A0D9X1S1_9ORYZ
MSRHAAVVVVLAVLALASGAASQSPAPAAGPAADCGSSITALAGCLTYITPGSTDARPPKDCCAGVKSALGSPAAVACLCNALGQDFGIKINYTRAAALPAACGGDPSALSKCNKKIPGASPTEAPSSSSGSGSTPATGTPSSPKSAAAQSPVSATLLVAIVAAPLLSYYYL